jgi:guanylate kinase
MANEPKKSADTRSSTITPMPPVTDFSRRCLEPLLIVISGPSASGKDTVVQSMKEHGQEFRFVVTATTRERRPGEVHGRDYWFVTKAEFARMVKEGELLEHAMVYGDEKGVPRTQVREALASGRDVVMRLDVQGAETVRRLVPDALLIFITVDSEEEMIKRLQERKTETAEERAVRTATAREELKRVEAFDYVIVNHDDRLEHTVDVVRAIIEAEHHRVRQRKVSL